MDQRAQDSANGPVDAPQHVARRELLPALVRGARSVATAPPGIYATAAVAASAALGEIVAAGARPVSPTNGLRPLPGDLAVEFAARHGGVSVERAAQIIYVRRLHNTVEQAARAVFGDRLVAVLMDEHGRLVIAVTGVHAPDAEHVHRMAAHFGIQDWLRVQPAAQAS